MLGSVVSSGRSHLGRRAAQGPFLWAAPQGVREQNPNTTNIRMSVRRALGMPMTFWAVVSFQRSLPCDGLQVCQQVPLPLSLWELQVRLQNLRQGGVALPGPHQPQQHPGERARPVCVLLPSVSLSQPGQRGGGAGWGRQGTGQGPGPAAPGRDSVSHAPFELASSRPGKGTVGPWAPGGPWAGVQIGAPLLRSVMSPQPWVGTTCWTVALHLASFRPSWNCAPFPQRPRIL